MWSLKVPSWTGSGSPTQQANWEQGCRLISDFHSGRWCGSFRVLQRLDTWASLMVHVFSWQPLASYRASTTDKKHRGERSEIWQQRSLWGFISWMASHHFRYAPLNNRNRLSLVGKRSPQSRPGGNPGWRPSCIPYNIIFPWLILKSHLFICNSWYQSGITSFPHNIIWEIFTFYFQKNVNVVWTSRINLNQHV